MKTKITKKALAYLPQDQEYKEYTLTSVKDNGKEWDIGSYVGQLLIPKTSFIPESGMRVKYYGKGFGYTIRGVVIEDTPIYYKTAKEADQVHKKWCDKMEREQKKLYLKHKKDIRKRINALPEPLKNRMVRFGKEKADFNRYDYVSYELYCCEEAVKILKTFDDPENIVKWAREGYDRTVCAVDDGHTGNTIGGAARLAIACLRGEKM